MFKSTLYAQYIYAPPPPLTEYVLVLLGLGQTSNLSRVEYI